MRLIIYLCLPTIGLLLTNCRTPIPARDTVLPTFVFHITGDGFTTEINQNFDFDNQALYLKRDALYNAFFIASDPGGVKAASMTMPGVGVIAIGRRTGDFSIANSGDPYIEKYACTNCGSEVRTRAALNFHRLQTIGGPLDGNITNHEFVFGITDYHDNPLEKTLIVRITNEPTGIRSRD